MKGTNERRLVLALAAAGLVLSAGALEAQQLSNLDCLIQPHSVSDVSTREQGVLEEVLVERGDVVKKGQVVARLESRLEKVALQLATARAEMTGEIEAAQAKLDYVRRQQTRINDLYTGKAVSFNEKDKAETDVRLAETELQVATDNHRLAQLERDRAAQQLELRNIRSPVDGVIVEIKLVPGESVEDRAREIMRIAEIDPLNVEVILPADSFGLVRVGMPAEITPLLPGSTVKTSKVSVVDRTIDAASATFGVRLLLDNKDLAIPGGIRCNIGFAEPTQAQAVD
jgi:RND family efflux transporter MFP subunit